MVDLSRRKFMLAGTASLLSMGGSVTAQIEQLDGEYEIQGVADLLGPAAARPDPDDPFFDDKLAYAYRYQARDTGARWFITDADDAWAALEVTTPRVNVADATEIYESDAGSTVIENTNDRPINVQLSPSGRAYFVGNDTVETVIDQQDVWYEIEGPWDSAHLNFLTAVGDGGLTYHGDVTTQIQYIIGGAYTSPDNNAEYELGIFKNGELKPRTPIDFSPPRKDESLTLPTVSGFTDTTEEGMTHTPRVRCTSGTTNLVLNGINFTIRG